MIVFFNSFFQYLVLMVVFVAVGAVGAFLGIQARKRKNAQEAAAETEKKAEQ
ncbi:MAG: hypothetical protein ACI39H_07370 [Lachnospiraceae bacterium]